MLCSRSGVHLSEIEKPKKGGASGGIDISLWGLKGWIGRARKSREQG